MTTRLAISIRSTTLECRISLIIFLPEGVVFSGAPGGPAARGASWVRKYGNPSMREILVKVSGMARERVRLRRSAVRRLR